MTDYPKKARLKDGSEILIRPLDPNDYDKLLEFFRNIPEEDRMFLKDDVANPETIKGWFKEFNPEKVFPIVVLDGDKIIADCTLHRAVHGWSKHVGEIRVVVSKNYQKKGIGIILLDELFHQAMRSGVEKMMALVPKSQEKVTKAFEKFGFIKEAILKDHIIDITGMKRDLIIMTRNVDDLIRKMEDLIISSSLSME
jgi:L-amino acid N-acyltransferase YncA